LFMVTTLFTLLFAGIALAEVFIGTDEPDRYSGTPEADKIYGYGGRTTWRAIEQTTPSTEA
jgi:hypothetical protein